MILGFLITLGITLIAAYIFKNAVEEMAYLAASILGVSMLVSLFLAPWPLKLALLAFVFIKTRELSLTDDRRVAKNIPQSLEASKSKLIYRGSTYEYNASSDRNGAVKSMESFGDNNDRQKVIYRGFTYDYNSATNQ